MTGFFEFIADDIEAGYSSDGFFAFGVSRAHRFETDTYSMPRIGGVPVQWSIRVNGKDPFEEYATYAGLDGIQSPRIPLLREYFSVVENRPKGEMRRLEAGGSVSLNFYLPNDPSITAFIMGIVAAERELVVWSPGWHFLDQDETPAPAASIDGFMNRAEPAFTLYPPTLRLR